MTRKRTTTSGDLRRSATTCDDLPGFPLCHVRAGDVITIDGTNRRRTVEAAWWVSKTQQHALRFADDEQPHLFATTEAPDVTLHSRPGYGPFHHRYAVGDRVHFFARDASRELGGSDSLGIVATVHAYPAPIGHGGNEHTVYEIRPAGWTSTVAKGAEDMRLDTAPAPAAGQRWYSPVTGTVVKVRKVRECGLIAFTTRGDFILSEPDWLCVDESVRDPRWTPDLRQVAAHANDLRQCRCRHQHHSHGNEVDDVYVGVGNGACGMDDCRCTRFVDVLAVANGAPRCHAHKRPMAKRTDTTDDQRWCGTWWACRAEDCGRQVLTPSPQYMAYLAERRKQAEYHDGSLRRRAKHGMAPRTLPALLAQYPTQP